MYGQPEYFAVVLPVHGFQSLAVGRSDEAMLSLHETSFHGKGGYDAFQDNFLASFLTYFRNGG